MPTPEGVDESLFSELKDALKEALLETVGARHAVPLRTLTTDDRGLTPAKLVSKPPAGPSNRVDDLMLIDNGDGTYTLTWSYRNVGDYNQDGIVSISDITPLAVHFNEPADETNEWIDGNGDSIINIQDITPLAANYATEVADYLIEGATSIEGPFAEVDTVLLSEAEGGDTSRKCFQYELAPGENQYFRVVARDGDGTRAEASNVVGLALEILSVTPTEVKEGTVVTFSAEVVGAGPLTYEWDFSGQTVPPTSTEPSPKVVLTREVGDFPASLTVTSPATSVTHNFTLHKLARQWVYETVLQVEKPDDMPSAGGLREFGGKLYFLVAIYDPTIIAPPHTRYLVSGNPGNWSFEEIDYYGTLELTSQGAPGILAYVGPFMHYDLTLAEKVGGSWHEDVVQEGLELKQSGFAFTRDDVPFVAYKFRYWEPERTEDIRFARRVNGEWLHGILDDEGGLGAEVPPGPIVMRVDPEGNPAVAYRVQVEVVPGWVWYDELRLARWNPSTEDWDKQVVLDNSSSVFDLSFDPEGRPAFVYCWYSSESHTRGITYAVLEDGRWEEDIVEEWPTGTGSVWSLHLAYDGLRRPLLAYTLNSAVNVTWFTRTEWERTEIASSADMDRVPELVVDQVSTPYVLYVDDDTKEVILARYE